MDATRKGPNNPRAKSNFLSIATFFWTIPTFHRGLKSDFTVNDLTEPLNEHASCHMGSKIEKAWKRELETSLANGRNPSFMRVIIRMFGPKFLLYALPVFTVEAILKVAQPVLLGELIKYFRPQTTVTCTEAYLYAAGIAFCSIFAVLLSHPFMHGTTHLGMKLRVAASDLIFNTAVGMTQASQEKTSTGHIINLISNDVSKYDYAFLFLHSLWLAPLQTLLVTILVWRQVGWLALIAIFIILLIIPILTVMSKIAENVRTKLSYRTDERIKTMNEIISGIQVIKMYTWEAPFIKMVNETRQKEINEIAKYSHLKGIFLSFIIFHTRIAYFITIVAYVLMGHSITAEQVFVVIALINTLRNSMTVFFPQALIALVEAIVSTRRITKFLTSTHEITREIKSQETILAHHMRKESTGKSRLQLLKTPLGRYIRLRKTVQTAGVKIENAYAKWDVDSQEYCLSNINMEVRPHGLNVIIGPVGAGKTSLLYAILNELVLMGGAVLVSGTISYASQNPWLFNGTVRENILFGTVFDKVRYKEIIRVCSLRTDLEILPHGDKTIVGERGTTLSGGQRARINLARAIYKDSDIYLLDDPLSAVDTHVGKSIFEDCVQDYLKEKTVILVTHQVQYLGDVDNIILLQNGKILAVGTYFELIQTGHDFTKFLALQRRHPTMDDVMTESYVTLVENISESTLHKYSSEDLIEVKIIPDDENAELQEMGSVKVRVYKKYFVAMGTRFMIFLMLMLFITTQVLASISDYWIAYWVEVEEQHFSLGESYKISRDLFIIILSVLTIGVIVVSLIRTFVYFFMCMRASLKLHNAMFSSLVGAKMSFFNKQNSGRILNRFSKDIGIVDEYLPQALIDVIQIGLALVAIVIIVAAVNFWLLIPTAVCCVIFYLLRVVYVSTSQGVKRVESISRSPLYCHVSETLLGLATIRAFGAEQQMITKFRKRLDTHSSAWFMYIAVSRAFGYILDLICAFYISIVTLSFLFIDMGVTDSKVGLAISQAVVITGMFEWGMRQTAELQNCMTSVERVSEYSELEGEADLDHPPDNIPDPSWPDKGRIIFKNVFLRYDPNDPWVLRDLNFTVEAQEKVGIVGRTGAGKSSLIGSLFRLAELKGTIDIDGINITTIGLHELRSKISIIPQEPMLFAASMRKNIDPFDEYTDSQLWNALDEVELKDTIKDMPEGLNSMISEGGVNLSIGQKQLVCLARAVLRRHRILVLDEATANVDPGTDALIQKTIRLKFKECTVMTIAHRLNTVMDSDKVFVLSGGTLVEQGHPYDLLQNTKGYFYNLVGQTGKDHEKMLHDLAAQSFKRDTWQHLSSGNPTTGGDLPLGTSRSEAN